MMNIYQQCIKKCTKIASYLYERADYNGSCIHHGIMRFIWGKKSLQNDQLLMSKEHHVDWEGFSKAPVKIADAMFLRGEEIH